MACTFVWVKGLRGPEPQIFTGETRPMDSEREKAKILASIEVDETMTLQACIAAFPAPAWSV